MELVCYNPSGGGIMSTEQRGIGSVEVGGQLLRVLTEADGPMMLRDLAASAGMTAAKAHPYMVSYMRLGLVEQDRASGRYELGPLALQMGLASMRRLNPVRIATEAIAELVVRINQTVALSVWGNHGPTVVRIEEGTGAVHVNMRVGRASVGDEAQRQMTRNQIDKAVAEIREKGLARAVEKPIPGVNAFSAPV